MAYMPLGLLHVASLDGMWMSTSQLQMDPHDLLAVPYETTL